MTNAELLAEIERLEKAATPGPWFVSKPFTSVQTDCEETFTIGPFDQDAHYEDALMEVWGENYPSEANARLVVALVSNLPAILSALRGVKAAREALADAAHALRLTHQLGAPMSACDEAADRCCEAILALSEVTP